MKVKINNKEEDIEEKISVLNLLASKDIQANSSVWVNGRQLLLKEYADYLIKENDEIKIFKIVYGG